MGREPGFTLLELLVVIAIVGVLAALSVGATVYASREAQAAQCASNLRQWGMALHLYCADNNGYLPRRGQGVQPVTNISRPTDWFNALPPYLGTATFQVLVSGTNGVPPRPPQPGDKSIFVCPAATAASAGQYFLCYGMNMNLSTWNQTNATKFTQVPNPEFLAFMADSPGGYASTVPSSAQYSVQPRHNGSANVVFLDGHVAVFPGSYLGCGVGEMEQPDVRWQPDIPGITWNAP